VGALRVSFLLTSRLKKLISLLTFKIMNKEKSFIVDKALGFLAISESEGTKRGTASNGHVKSDVHTH
jgi:hypothetical protein